MLIYSSISLCKIRFMVYCTHVKSIGDKIMIKAPENYITRGDKGYWVWSENFEKILIELPTYLEALVYSGRRYGYRTGVKWDGEEGQ